jgi:excisionase family DNA binding protein
MSDLLTVAAVAARLSLSRDQVYAMVARRELPSVRFGRAVRIPEEGLEDVKQTLGHSSIRLTSDTYSHPQEERQREVAERMQTAIGGAR